MTDPISNPESLPIKNWPFRWSVLLGLITFPLIWVGGLVTTTDAGMAVPDWPNTYGYNLFLYPYTTWFSGPWDLFIEHGHRLLGSLAGFVAIILVISTFRNSKSQSLRWLAVGALVLVIAQGVLGGVRVLAIDRFLAKVHGCVGPAFFAYTAAFAAISYRKNSPEPGSKPASKTKRPTLFLWMACLLVISSFLQLVLGANLRHIEEHASFHLFQWLIISHLVFAILVWALSTVVLLLRKKSGLQNSSIRRTCRTVFGLVLIQVLLGLATWLVKYHWPFNADQFSLFANLLIIEKSMWQTSIVTAHVAMGSLILMTSTVLTVVAFKETHSTNYQNNLSSQTVSYTGATA